MKIALAASPVKNKDISYNLRSMENAISQASGSADLILFGEAFLQGFDALCWDYAADKAVACSLSSPEILRIRKAAKENRIAVSFGFIERDDDILYSSQLFIGADGNPINLFRRVSKGWKEYSETDNHYREGTHFSSFRYAGKTFATGLCGDLWTQGRPEEMKALDADIVLWPVWCDYPTEEWNREIKLEYAAQAALCGKDVLLVNPYCVDPNYAAGGCAHFSDGAIQAEFSSGSPGMLLVNIP